MLTRVAGWGHEGHRPALPGVGCSIGAHMHLGFGVVVAARSAPCIWRACDIEASWLVDLLLCWHIQTCAAIVAVFDTRPGEWCLSTLLLTNSLLECRMTNKHDYSSVLMALAWLVSAQALMCKCTSMSKVWLTDSCTGLFPDKHARSACRCLRCSLHGHTDVIAESKWVSSMLPTLQLKLHIEQLSNARHVICNQVSFEELSWSTISMLPRKSTP